ncbi:hypothetical protein M3Y96_00347800 [Aphelenchoides besseyi]|nr:hypothetical protein M3Y96_00347800 [Aphelenchoides besseyi]
MEGPIAHALCDVVLSIYEKDWTLKFVFLFQFFGALLSVVCMVSLGLLLCAWSAFSIDVRLLMLSQLSAFGTANIGVLLSCVYHLQALIFRSIESRCYWFSFTYYDCFVIRTVFNVSICSVYASGLVMAIERLLSTLIDLNLRSRKRISILLIGLQWSFAIGANINPHTLNFVEGTRSVHHAHCTAHFPTPTQSQQLFYVLMGFNGLMLGMYTALCCHVSSHYIIKELKKFNKSLYENVISTESVFPLILITAALYISSVLMDRNFQLTIWGLLTERPDIPLSRSLTRIAQWTEFQTTLIPLLSLILFGILIRKAWPEEVYGQVVSEYARHSVLEAGYDSRNSDALSFHSVDATLHRGSLNTRPKHTQIGSSPSTPTIIPKNPALNTISSIDSTNESSGTTISRNCGSTLMMAKSQKELKATTEMDTLPL